MTGGPEEVWRRDTMRRTIDRIAGCTLAVGASLTTAAVSGGCITPEDQVVTASAETINATSAALGAGTLLWANGTYGAGCVSRSGNWSVRISGSDPMDNAALSVLQNNTACVLTLTGLVADQAYTASPSINMTTSYQGSASAFAPASGGSLSFYGNAALSASTFASNFVVTILYSDNPNPGTGAVTGGYASVSATSSATSVASPNYTLDLTTGALTVLTDVNYVVQSVSGTANLVQGTITGGGYFVDQGTLPASPTFAQLDTAYTAATKTAMSGSNPQTIPASAFGLSGVDLTTSAVRTIVIQRVVSGVPAYQTFKITVSHP
jgi:hypothetical protein